jgi:hypothetical protein
MRVISGNKLWILGVVCAGMMGSQVTAETAEPGDRLEGGELPTAMNLAWESIPGAVGYDVAVLFNGELVDTVRQTHEAITLEALFGPGYYTAIVRGLNAGGTGAWSEPVTFAEKREVTSGGKAALTAPPKSFSWNRTATATRYLVRLFWYNGATGQYVLKKEAWVAQSASSPIYWYPPAGMIGNGKYKVQVTDYAGTKPGMTSTLFFKVKIPVTLPVGTWLSSSANKYGLSVTVNSLAQISGAQLTAYYNDGWFSKDSYTFAASDITKNGSSFVAKKEKGIVNSSGESLYYYEISGTLQANGSITGTWKASYYQKPRFYSAHTNTKQGTFTAWR